MKKFSNLNKIEDAVTSFFENLGLEDVGGENNFGDTVNNYYINENDGTLSIVNGKLNLKPPKQGGNWPIIKSCENVSIKLRGKEVKAPIIVKNVEDIKINLRTNPRK